MKAGSESRADVAPKDGSAGIVAAEEDGTQQVIEDLRVKMNLGTTTLNIGGGQQFWADVGRSSNR